MRNLGNGVAGFCGALFVAFFGFGSFADDAPTERMIQTGMTEDGGYFSLPIPPDSALPWDRFAEAIAPQASECQAGETEGGGYLSIPIPPDSTLPWDQFAEAIVMAVGSGSHAYGDGNQQSKGTGTLFFAWGSTSLDQAAHCLGFSAYKGGNGPKKSTVPLGPFDPCP